MQSLVKAVMEGYEGLRTVTKSVSKTTPKMNVEIFFFRYFFSI